MKSTLCSRQGKQELSGFTLAELLVVMGVLAILALTVLPALGRSRPNGKAAQCRNNLRQLMVGWRMYADDNFEEMINNFGLSDTMGEIYARRYCNWANNVMSWSTDQMVTNKALLEAGVLGTMDKPDYEAGGQVFLCDTNFGRRGA